MFCHLGRIGSSLSDRIVISSFKNSGTGMEEFCPRIANSWWDWVLRIVSWIYSPASYTSENRRSIQCFRKMIEPVGEDRLKRICNRYNINLEKMEKEGSPLLSRTIAKIAVGISDVKTEDMEKIRQFVHEDRSKLPAYISHPSLLKALKKVRSVSELSPKDFAHLYDALAFPAKSFQLPKMPELNGSAPSEFWARFVFDQFLADRERLGLQAEHPYSALEAVIHNICVRGMRRKMDVGMLIPGPNHSENGSKQFWRVAAILVTGDGQVSIVVEPATGGTDLDTIRFYRGTSTTPSEVDAFSSIITDLEPHIGTTADKSGGTYEPVIKKYLPNTKKVAGHSLGSTLAQIATSRNPEIVEGWYWAGPSPEDKYAERFNQRMSLPGAKPVTLHIRDAGNDDLSVMGSGYHLGYKAPEKVKIDFLFYSAMKKTGRLGVHTMMWNNQKFYGMAGGHHSAAIDRYLNHKSLVSFEWLRKGVGPYLVKILRLIRDFFRYMLQPKTYAIRGLQMGLYRQGEWRVYHIRPHQTSKAMDNLERYDVAHRKQKLGVVK